MFFGFGGLFLVAILVVVLTMGKNRGGEIEIRAKIAEARRTGKLVTEKTDDELIHHALNKQASYQRGFVLRLAGFFGMAVVALVLVLIGSVMKDGETNSFLGSTLVWLLSLAAALYAIWLLFSGFWVLISPRRRNSYLNFES